MSAVATPPGVSTGRPAGQVVITQATLQGKQTGAQTVQRQLTPQQLAALKQQAIKKQIQDQQMKQRQLLAGGAGNSAGGSKGTTMVGTVARGGQLVRTGGTVRSMTEAEVKQLMAKQQLKVGAGGVVQVPAGTSLTHAQLQQLGIQVRKVHICCLQSGNTVNNLSSGCGHLTCLLPLHLDPSHPGQDRAGHQCCGRYFNLQTRWIFLHLCFKVSLPRKKFDPPHPCIYHCP